MHSRTSCEWTVTVLGIPDTNDVFCVLPIGYPSDQYGPVRRKPVRDVVYINHFGERWDFAEAQADIGWEDKWLSR